MENKTNQTKTVGKTTKLNECTNGFCEECCVCYLFDGENVLPSDSKKDSKEIKLVEYASTNQCWYIYEDNKLSGILHASDIRKLVNKFKEVKK